MRWLSQLLAKSQRHPQRHPQRHSQNHLKQPKGAPHSLFDDAQGVLTGMLLMSLGITIFQSAQLMTGGVTGLALLLHYSLGFPLSLSLLCMNIPFFVLGYYRFGRAFFTKSLLAVFGLVVLIELMRYWIVIESINHYFAAVLGGLLVGVGLIFLFRHRASMGGFNILVLYLQDKFHWNAGLSQLLLDVAVIASFAWIGYTGGHAIGHAGVIIASFLGAAVLNLAITINHRPGRYISF
ncbi:YitT family protein [Cardiobacteriales bacterium ML27]|uniref:YitT family protein n=2 Tax=Ostreibacterium oceani TaxID=2654998 RepID=A0A6N7EW26_9GAMM|nr:YitT family protein [Ostreibacterium oceani]